MRPTVSIYYTVVMPANKRMAARANNSTLLGFILVSNAVFVLLCFWSSSCMITLRTCYWQQRSRAYSSRGLKHSKSVFRAVVFLHRDSEAAVTWVSAGHFWGVAAGDKRDENHCRKELDQLKKTKTNLFESVYSNP